MSGPINIYLDTNAVIALLERNPVVSRLVGASNRVTISVISVIECRVGLRPLSTHADLFDGMLSRMTVDSLNFKDVTLQNRVVSIRQTYRLKLPDAIIAASALVRGETLVTRDHHFQCVNGLTLIDF